MILSNLRIEKNETWAKLICDVDSPNFTEKTLYYKVPVKYHSYLSTNSYNAFLVGLLYPAMYHKEDITIKGAVSKKLYKNITPYVQSILTDYSKDLSKIVINIDSFVTTKQIEKLNASGFSGGVDSFSTFQQYFDFENDPEYRINTLFFFNVGSHGRYDNSKTFEKFSARYQYLKIFTTEKSIPFIMVDSNLHYFHDVFGHQRTHPISLCAGILALESVINRYYISSTLSYGEAKLYGKEHFDFDLAEFSETYLLPLLSTEKCTIVPDGEQYTRSEKTKLLIDYLPAQKYLNVCVHDQISDHKNCSGCSKCLRTLLTLENLNSLHQFSSVFNLQIYKKKAFKYKCLQRIEYSKSPFAKDNIDLARKMGKKVPSLFVSIIVQAPALLFSTVKKNIKETIKKIIGKQNFQKLKTYLKSDKNKTTKDKSK